MCWAATLPSTVSQALAGHAVPSDDDAFAALQAGYAECGRAPVPAGSGRKHPQLSCSARATMMPSGPRT
jgi:hypothetical protein